ncbi:hypothetical protein H9M94_03150 [Mycoplasma sp. Pen4]|uniref:hypothetical protein n=1 Tax=Mycoplasma sp. Pen4 TaxID=640330 RepID=UPI0016543479|nr:hypothetical protein [Mycoplasma sp. Pen4]QNM93575.1 hypothetical protein H9M94_03150 [Mycoplasma sp. Pen4]
MKKINFKKRILPFLLVGTTTAVVPMMAVSCLYKDEYSMKFAFKYDKSNPYINHAKRIDENEEIKKLVEEKPEFKTFIERLNTTQMMVFTFNNWELGFQDTYKITNSSFTKTVYRPYNIVRTYSESSNEPYYKVVIDENKIKGINESHVNLIKKAIDAINENWEKFYKFIHTFEGSKTNAEGENTPEYKKFLEINKLFNEQIQTLYGAENLVLSKVDTLSLAKMVPDQFTTLFNEGVITNLKKLQSYTYTNNDPETLKKVITREEFQKVIKWYFEDSPLLMPIIMAIDANKPGASSEAEKYKDIFKETDLPGQVYTETSPKETSTIFSFTFNPFGSTVGIASRGLPAYVYANMTKIAMLTPEQNGLKVNDNNSIDWEYYQSHQEELKNIVAKIDLNKLKEEQINFDNVTSNVKKSFINLINYFNISNSAFKFKNVNETSTDKSLSLPAGSINGFIPENLFNGATDTQPDKWSETNAMFINKAFLEYDEFRTLLNEAPDEGERERINTDYKKPDSTLFTNKLKIDFSVNPDVFISEHLSLLYYGDIYNEYNYVNANSAYYKTYEAYNNVIKLLTNKEEFDKIIQRRARGNKKQFELLSKELRNNLETFKPLLEKTLSLGDYSENIDSTSFKGVHNAVIKALEELKSKQEARHEKVKEYQAKPENSEKTYAEMLQDPKIKALDDAIDEILNRTYTIASYKYSSRGVRDESVENLTLMSSLVKRTDIQDTDKAIDVKGGRYVNKVWQRESKTFGTSILAYNEIFPKVLNTLGNVDGQIVFGTKEINGVEKEYYWVEIKNTDEKWFMVDPYQLFTEKRIITLNDLHETLPLGYKVNPTFATTSTVHVK